MTAQNISLHQQVEFVNYCEMFYGEGQMYATRDHATRDQIWGAMLTYLQGVDDGTYHWGGGDSIDREIVAEILINEFRVELY